MSDDYIRRGDAIRLAEQGQAQGFPWQFQMLVRLPPADVAPVVHGRWKYRGVCGIKDNITIRRYKCSECREDIVCDCSYNFCPYCGAKMDEDDKYE